MKKNIIIGLLLLSHFIVGGYAIINSQESKRNLERTEELVRIVIEQAQENAVPTEKTRMIEEFKRLEACSEKIYRLL